MRRLLPAVALLILLSVFSTARAQILSIYGTYSPVNASNVQTGVIQTSQSGLQTQYTSFWASGVGGGVTVNFLPLPIISLGMDFRGSTRPGTVGADTAMVGLKLGIHPPVIRIKPYIQGSAGYLDTRTVNVSVGGGTFNNQYITYEILGGIDYPLVHFIDLRVIEIGGGKGYNINSGADANLFTINTGLVLHF
jgi:hypothetical protein